MYDITTQYFAERGSEEGNASITETPALRFVEDVLYVQLVVE